MNYRHELPAGSLAGMAFGVDEKLYLVDERQSRPRIDVAKANNKVNRTTGGTVIVDELRFPFGSRRENSRRDQGSNPYSFAMAGADSIRVDVVEDGFR